MANGLLAETRTISLEVGSRILVIGVNQTCVPHKFHAPGEHRCVWADVGTARTFRELPGRNFSAVVINGKISNSIVDEMIALADQAKAQTILIVENGGSIQRLMEDFPLENKGVITIEVSGVIKEVETSASQTPNRQTQNIAPPAKIPETPPPAVAQAPDKPAKSAEPQCANIGIAEMFLAAVNASIDSQTKAATLAMGVVEENKRLQAQVVDQAERIIRLEQKIAGLEKQNTGLREKISAAKALFQG